jgi:hypothetical protein
MKDVEFGDPLSRQAPQHLAAAHRRVLNHATPILLDGANAADLGDALRSSTSAVGSARRTANHELLSVAELVGFLREAIEPIAAVEPAALLEADAG